MIKTLRFAVTLTAISIVALLTGACGKSSADAVGTGKATVPPPKYPAHLAGFPPVGAHASLPTHGRNLLQLSGGWLYADGHIIIGEGVQRLTPQGAHLLWSKIRAIGLAAGLFQHTFNSVRVCSGGRLRPLADGRGAAQARAIARINTLFANASSWLPAGAWADRTIRPYVPSHYGLVFDRMAPDPAKLPSPAREVLAQYQPLLHHAEQGVTTDQARALIAAFEQAGVKLVHDNALELDFRLPTAHGDGFFGPNTILEFRQSFPGDGAARCSYSYGGSSGRVAVPAVTHQRLDQAERTLARFHLGYKGYGDDGGAKLPATAKHKYEVCFQSPGLGKLARGRRVALFLTGPGQCYLDSLMSRLGLNETLPSAWSRWRSPPPGSRTP